MMPEDHQHPSPSASTRLSGLRILRTTAAAAVLAIIATMLTVPAAHADSNVPMVTVAFTGGRGVFMRSEPRMGSEKLVLLPEGSLVDEVCEVTSEAVTNEYGQTITTWMRNSGGGYLPGAFANSGYLERTPGVPDCADVDAKMLAQLQPVAPSVSALHREGVPVVEVHSEDGNHVRRYYSLAETRSAANYLHRASGGLAALKLIACGGVDVVIAIGTRGSGLRTSTGAGVAAGVSCDKLLENQTSDPAAIAGAAASSCKCLEVRVTRDGDRWRPNDGDGFTMTEHSNYCG